MLPHKTGKDKLSYAIGVDVARNFKRQEVDLNFLMKGLNNGSSGQELLAVKREAFLTHYPQREVGGRDAVWEVP